MSDNEKKGLSRRNFLKNAGLAIGGAAIGGGIVGSITSKQPKEVEKPTEKVVVENPNRALMYFTPDQFPIAEAAVERIFPKDENGPGAKELNVAYYIDHQLASGWGTGAKEYTSGPFYPGEPTQGYQSQLNRQQLFDIGLKGMEDYSVKTFKKSFKDITPEEQDKVIGALEKGELTLKGVSSKYFFALLKTATLEGVYSDPLYGGNNDMGGWKMKNFPGHQGSYADIIEKDEFVKKAPQGLNSQHKH